jgi:broad specificity phosphatase PhoE
MKRLFLLICLIGLSIPSLNAQNSILSKDNATFIFVRHAEKADDGTSNPPLTKEGEARAERIKNFLKTGYKSVDAVFSTDYKRTEFTAQPTAKEFGLTIQKYDPRAPNVFIKTLIKDYAGKVVLIVGHSNTTPLLVNTILDENRFEQLDESDYDEVFIVKASGIGKAKVEVKSSAITKN